MQKQLMRLIILVIMPLAVAQGQEFYEGDTVRTSDDSVGTVKQIFSNGIVRVQIGKGASEQGVFEYTLNQLSKAISSCLEEICINDTVRTSDDSVGTVKQIFSNGIVRVQIGKGASEQGVFEYTLNQLSLQECSRIGGANCRQ